MAAGGPPKAELRRLDRRIDRLSFGTSPALSTPVPPPVARIAVAFDGSAPSRFALQWAAALAQRTGARIDLVTVAPPRAGRPGQGDWAAVLAMAGEADHGADRALRDGETWLKERGLRVAVHLEEGPPVARILDVAHRLRCGLLVLGAHSKKGPMRLGSVADGVRHHCRAPVLIARNAPPPKRILAGTDGSARSRRAVAVAMRWAGLLEARLTLLHSVDLPSFGETPQAYALEQGKAQAILQELRADDARGSATYELQGGPAATAILDSAATSGAGLVVVGSRGRGPMRSLSLGSVSERVSRDCPASVLVVKG